MTDYVVRDTQLTSVANAIRTKGGTSATLSFPDGFVSAVNAISTGGGPVSVPAKEVNFRDYDGTVVYSYTPAEFAALSTMPANPDHSHDKIPLTAQGWNWSLSDAQTYVAKYKRLEIGQMYITADGKTHIKIYIDPSTPANRMTFYLRWTQSVSNGVTVDWGDGSATQTYSGTSAANHDHTYAAGGWYDITLTVTSGNVQFNGASSYFIGGSSGSDNAHNRGRIREVRFGSGLHTAAVGPYCFYSCYDLAVVTMPDGVTTIGTYAFSICYSMTDVTVPDSVTTIDAYAFSSCYNLTSITIPKGISAINYGAFMNCATLSYVTIPDGVTTIGTSAFNGCYSMTDVTVPDNVTTISNNAFQYNYSLIVIAIPNEVTSIKASAFASCNGLGEIHFRSTTPPVIANANAFSGIPTDCKIYVPTGSLAAYKSATNYPSASSYTYIGE